MNTINFNNRRNDSLNIEGVINSSNNVLNFKQSFSNLNNSIEINKDETDEIILDKNLNQYICPKCKEFVILWIDKCPYCKNALNWDKYLFE